MLLGMALCFGLMIALFGNFIGSYKNNIVNESASHLSEINAQIRIYVEEKINNDWKVAQSIANTIISYSPQNNEKELAELIRQERDIWHVSDVYIYTEDGSSIGADGDIKNKDVAADLVYNVRKHGKYMTILSSTVTYTIPVETTAELHGSKVVALSVVQDLESLVDNMGISSFDGTSCVYLTQDNGSKISQLTTTGAPDLYNVFSLFDNKKIKCLNEEDYVFEGSLPTDQSYAFLLEDGDSGSYVLSTPIHTESGVWRLFYAVPEAVANKTTNDFSSYVTFLSFSVIGIFSVCGLIAFVTLYKSRKKKFDRAMVARDRMLDLLVTNTRNAFALLSTRQDTPLYVSSNCKEIIGDISLQLVGGDQTYQIKNFGGAETDSIRTVNSELIHWNGVEEFTSPFLPYTDGSGALRHFVLRIYPVEKEPSEFIVIAQDVTQERAREEMLKNAIAMADSANIAKTKFLSNMSHDIRTPMNAIVNMTRFAIDTVDDKAAQLEYLHTIQESADHLLHLINDILDLSRIESGQVSIAFTPFDLGDCLKEVCEMVAPLCHAKGQEFHTDTSGLHSVSLLGDKLKLSQVLINLLNNAVKFTQEQGQIRFVVKELHSLKPGIVSLAFEVQDNGRGISEADLQTIFDPFVRASGGAVNKIEGTGLGLSICKSYIAAMGGQISCKSELGAGSTFLVELFFEKNMEATKAASNSAVTQQASFHGKRALLCEDHKVNQVIARKLLEKLGFTVDVASDGAEGVDKFTSSTAGTYDVIYMDIQMPNLNGYEAAQVIRSSGHPNAGIPIIAMTANAFAEDVEKARAAGMNGHVAKPIVLEALITETKKIF